MFTEIYLKDPTNIGMVLDTLEEQDFYVRYDVILLLQALLNNALSLVQAAVLSSPLGLAKLADLLDEKREIIRNGNGGYHSIDLLTKIRGYFADHVTH